MNIYLLTHPRELKKKSNTGVLVQHVLGDLCELFVWHRKEPSEQLLDKIAHESVGLVYPCDDAVSIQSSAAFDSYILLDGTWQQAQKMYNQSPYLKTLPKVRIETGQKSIYKLRRNQKEHGLCTAECAVEILNSNGFHQKAGSIRQSLVSFIAGKDSINIGSKANV